MRINIKNRMPSIIRLIIGRGIIIYGLIFIFMVIWSVIVNCFLLSFLYVLQLCVFAAYGILALFAGINIVKHKNWAKKAVIWLIVLPLLPLLALEPGYITGQNYPVKLPYLIKFATLWEREKYYKTWINEIIAKGISDNKTKIEKIAKWIKDLPEELPQFSNALGNVEQHEYYTLVKQYGTLSEKTRVFCNLMAVEGYTASTIYGFEDKHVIVKMPREFLYFNLKVGEPIDSLSLKKEMDKGYCEIELKKLDNIVKKFFSRKYLWGDINVCRYAFLYYFQKLFFEPLLGKGLESEEVKHMKTLI